MRGVFAALLLGALLSCAAATTGSAVDGGTGASSGSSSGSSGGTSGLAAFEGAEWSGTQYITETCYAGEPASGTGSLNIVFQPYGSNGLTFTSSDYCVYQFSVSGQTATLSNGPVSCNADTEAGVFETFSWTSFTATTTDGHNMSGSVSGSVAAGGLTCTVQSSFTATR